MEQLQVEKSQDFSSTIFNITKHGFQELQKAGLTLDQLFYLETCKWNIDLKDIITKDKYLTWRQSLIRKGFLTESGSPTVDGEAVLKAVGSGQPFKGALEKAQEGVVHAFERWWKAYPATDIFEHKGYKFDGTRSLKRKKDECKEKFIKIIQEGECTVEDLIRSLEYEVVTRKEASVKERQNQMRYMVNSLTYLNQKAFEGFLEISKTEKVRHYYGQNDDI